MGRAAAGKQEGKRGRGDSDRIGIHVLVLLNAQAPGWWGSVEERVLVSGKKRGMQYSRRSFE